MVRSVAGMRVIGIMALAAVFAFAAMTPVEQARALYHRTDYDAALKLLLPLEIKDGATWELVGRSYFMMGDFKGPMEKGMTYIVRPAMLPSNRPVNFFFISAGSAQLLVGPASSFVVEQM